MATEDLTRLARKAQSHAKLFLGGAAFVTSKSWIEEVAALPARLRDEIGNLATQVREIVPNDFSFTLGFEMHGLSLNTELEDGNSGSFGPGLFFTSRKSMLSKLRGQDWDEERTHLLQQFEMLDQMQSAADDRPPNIPSSRDAAQKYGPELNSIVSQIKANRDLGPYFLFVAREEEPIEACKLASREAVIQEMMDVMATGYDILAVLENGAAWSFEAIEAAKLEAVDRLGPISKAKAERRFF